MSDAHHASRGVRLTLAGQAVKFAIQLITTVLLARLLDPTDFGLFAMVAAITGFASLLSDFGFSTAAIQAEHISPRQKSNLFWLSTGIGVLLFGALYLASSAIESFYNQPGLAIIVQVLSCTFVISAITSQFTAQLTRDLKFGRLSIIDIVAQAVGLLTAVTMAIAGAGYWALVAQQLAVVVARLALTASLAQWLPRLPGKAPMGSLLSFAANSLGVQALSYLSGNVDSIALGRTSGADVVGLYNRAQQLFRIPMQQIAAPLTRVALPILSRHQKDRDRMSRYVVGAQAGVAYLLGAVFALGAALATPVIELLLGREWLAAAPIFAILALGGLFQVMGYVYYWTFLACGLTALQLRYSIFTRSLMVVLILVGAPAGAVGVAVAVSVSLALNWVVLSVLPMRRTGLDVRSIVITGVRATAVNGAAAVVVWLVDANLTDSLVSIARIGIGLAVASAVYGLGYLAFPQVRADLSSLARIARKRL